MNSKSLIHITLTKIFQNYENEIKMNNEKNSNISNNEVNLNDLKDAQIVKCCQNNENCYFDLNIDINIKPEHYKGNKKVINKMRLKLIKYKKI